MCEYYVDYEVYEETKYSAFNNLSKTDYDKLVGYLNDFHKEAFFYKSLCEAEQFSVAEKKYIKCVKLYNNISHIFLTEEVKEDFGFIEMIKFNVDDYIKRTTLDERDNKRKEKKVKDDDDSYDWAEIEVEHNIRELEKESGITRETKKTKKNKKRGNGRKEKKGKNNTEVPDIDIWDLFY